MVRFLQLNQNTLEGNMGIGKHTVFRGNHLEWNKVYILFQLGPRVLIFSTKSPTYGVSIWSLFPSQLFISILLDCNESEKNMKSLIKLYVLPR